MASKRQKEIQVVQIPARWMQRKQALKYLDISNHYFCKLIAEGKIIPHPAPDSGGRHLVWYDKEQIDAYMTSLQMR